MARSATFLACGSISFSSFPYASPIAILGHHHSIILHQDHQRSAGREDRHASFGQTMTIQSLLGDRTSRGRESLRPGGTTTLAAKIPAHSYPTMLLTATCQGQQKPTDRAARFFFTPTGSLTSPILRRAKRHTRYSFARGQHDEC